MDEIAKETLPANLEQEMRQSYLDYAMSVIVGRALPDVRDGLKPVHRRVLYAMSVLNNDWNKPYKKSARVVGDVIGKYHPHGDTAVYDAIVRLAQPFSLRYPLVDGQGNFGSVDGDAPAAMRYTEIRLDRIAHELLNDLDRETVDFVPNYDETEQQPAVLPARFPNLLVNGSAGIAVGMATNIPPHNLTETINACLAVIDDPKVTLEQLLSIMPGPDFPTSGIINGNRGIREAYQTGRGRVHIRARVEVEKIGASDREALVATELPYQVNKARLLEKIAELVRDKKLEGISGLRDESDKSGMRVVIELKKGENPEVILNNLYQHTQMQTVFGINLVALRNNQPRLFTLIELLEEIELRALLAVGPLGVFDMMHLGILGLETGITDGRAAKVRRQKGTAPVVQSAVRECGAYGDIRRQVFIFRAEPKNKSGRHFGCRLLFANGYLYATLGDRGNRPQAQDRGTHPGSVVRVMADGTVPPDNPFIGHSTDQPELYAYGNRNPQGLAQDPITGAIWMHEHGPRGGDELNRLIAGANYGWPVISYGKEYFLPKAVGEGTHKSGMEQPVHYWVPSIAPSGMTFYSGPDFPGWRGSLFLGSLKFQELVRLELDQGRVVAEERLLSGEFGRIRDVRQGPDGALYLLTDAAEGQLLKLVPAE